MARFVTFCLVCLSATTFGPAIAFPAQQEATAETATAQWIAVQVHTKNAEDVEIQIPLLLQELIQKVVDIERLSELTEGKAKAPLAAFISVLKGLQAAPPQDIFKVESDQATIKVATLAQKQTGETKPATVLRISVTPRQEKGDKVNITLPLGIFEMVAQCIKAAPMTEADFEAMGAGPEKTGLHLDVLVEELPGVVAKIRNMGEINLVSVKNPREEVRVWIE